MRRSVIVTAVICATWFYARSGYAMWYYNGNFGYVMGAVSPAAHTVQIPAAFSYNSYGATNTAVYLGVGSYTVQFPDLEIPLTSGGPAPGGDVQVTAIGTGARCKAAHWGVDPDGSTLEVTVACFSLRGDPVDSNFRASFVARTSYGVEEDGSPDPFQEGGYVWASSINGPTYTSGGPYTWNSTVQPVTVTPYSYGGPGTYTVRFEGQVGGFDFAVPNGCGAVPSYNGGTVQVTAYGSSNSFCNVGGWSTDGSDTYVNVFCFDGSSGAPTDSMFDLVYDTMSPNGLSDSAFTYAGNPTSAQYNPDGAWTAIIVPRTGDLERLPEPVIIGAGLAERQ